MLLKAEKSGVVLDKRNDSDVHIDVNYASVTAPELIYLEIEVDGEVFDGVHVGPGSSHSWWTTAGGKFLPASGLKPGSRLIVKATGRCALRLDWI